MNLVHAVQGGDAQGILVQELVSVRSAGGGTRRASSSDVLLLFLHYFLHFYARVYRARRGLVEELVLVRVMRHIIIIIIISEACSSRIW